LGVSGSISSIREPTPTNQIEKGGSQTNRMMDRFFENAASQDENDIADMKFRFQEKMQCLLEAEEMLKEALQTAKKEVCE
jgi:hypothetical protein